jgi:hypothetical protein
MNMTVCKGDVIRCREDIKTHGLIHWRAPFTGSFACTISAGTVLVVDVDPPEGATGFYCLPRDYHDFETKHVPSPDRTSEKYDGYSFVLNLADLGRRLEVISASNEIHPAKATVLRDRSESDFKRHNSMKLIHKALAPLASLKVQKRYIVKGTKDNYLLPEDLLNTAINILFEQQAVTFDETGALKELKEAIRACDIPEGMSNSEMILGCEPWIKVRETSKKYLSEIGFDLQAWEKHEL